MDGHFVQCIFHMVRHLRTQLSPPKGQLPHVLYEFDLHELSRLARKPRVVTSFIPEFTPGR